MIVMRHIACQQQQQKISILAHKWISTYDRRQLVQRCIERADHVQDLEVPVLKKIESEKTEMHND